jgi:hypothetical protein
MGKGETGIHRILFVDFTSSIFWYFRHAAVNSVTDFFSSGLRIPSFPDWILFDQDFGVPP